MFKLFTTNGLSVIWELFASWRNTHRPQAINKIGDREIVKSGSATAATSDVFEQNAYV